MARRARDQGVRRVRDLRQQARDQVNAALPPLVEPHLCFVRSPRRPIPPLTMPESLRVATYNVHRWQGVNGRARPDVARAGYVISELDADVIALQEVLRPFDEEAEAEDELGQLCEELDLHLAFAATRRHRRGQLGNAILSRFPITTISVLDISYSRIERRGALAAQVGHKGASLGIVATHLSLVDRTRHRQVQSLMEHPALNAGPAVLMGDMNAWRNCKGSQVLQESLGLHHNHDWPASFPSGRPLLALDRIYSRNADVVEVSQHDTPAARKASDHLPVVAEVVVKDGTGG
jgi:endonuclease/exonuclease/phosphatase family metal-dependent hydrolase